MNWILIAAAVSQAFNLNCSGESVSKSIEGEQRKPFNKVFHIDLEAGRWCSDECRNIFDVISVQPTSITLRDSTNFVGGMKMKWSEILDRQDGSYKSFSSIQSSVSPSFTEVRASCQKSEFTGFPSFDTKF